MKLSLFFIGLAAAGRKKVDPLPKDLDERLLELKRKTGQCVATLKPAEIGPASKGPDPKVSRNITRKLEYIHKKAVVYCQFQNEKCRDEFGDPRPDGIKFMSDERPCECLDNIMIEYKKLFNKVKKTYDSQKGTDHRNKRDVVIAKSNVVREKLTLRHSCSF